MNRRFRRGHAVGWALGVAAAAVSLTLGLLLGVFVVPAQQRLPLPVHATATHGQDNFAICTGQLEEGIDAIYFLDFLTGDLRAAALNVRTHRFQAFYQRRIIDDLGTKDVKNPRYLMVTGIADLQRQGRNDRYGRAVLYVAEINSGVCVAYGVPSVQNRVALGFQAAAPLVMIDRVPFRTEKIRE